MSPVSSYLIMFTRRVRTSRTQTDSFPWLLSICLPGHISAPLPTLACKSCTTCRDALPAYCAAPSTDPSSCGVCDSDRIAYPPPDEGLGQVAIFNSGQCGVARAQGNGYFGPGYNCRKLAFTPTSRSLVHSIAASAKSM